MSRALSEEDTPQSPSQNQAQKIYHSLTHILTQPRNPSSLLEIELLPKSHVLPPGQDYIIEDTSIAIPKRILVQAFIVAREILLRHVRLPKLEEGERNEDEEVELLKASFVILLMDAEHLTAANTRKRIVKSQMQLHPQNREEVFNSELGFVDTLLTARLHRHTKSPTLWSHRRWLLSLFHSSGPYETKNEYDILQGFKSVILVAAERHPKNYYAWSHARWLVETSSADGRGKGKEEIVQDLLPVVQDWALRHPNDISGFSFLFFCLSAVGSETRRKVYKQVLNLVVSFRWANESVWIFLRALAAFDRDIGEGFEDDVAQFMVSYSDTKNSKEQLTLRSAVAWYKENSHNKNPKT
ncbi:hypothetical protein HYFRA_00007460 [Hymenoscyphus fraxineus]|uniref:Protein prenylyltransferase n=1 Tax=Hymenoscyphus fraxineus TaxID=746836 RepID=A0A9N9PGC8_9HELO|nr:hypothetical protein HYFRA_00007460 [Hymenoscyphus fraxineus]